jgi:hypothetical protein
MALHLTRGMCFFLVLFMLPLAVLRPATIAQNDEVTYEGLTLHPGDVINFLGGGATIGNFEKYGHSALYLGVSPETHERTFLDFTTEKEGLGDWLLRHGSAQPFFGRLLAETDFLNANARWHSDFDVYRLRGSRVVDKSKMFVEAKRISNTESWGVSGDVCSSAVTAVLTKGVCKFEECRIRGFTPDDLTTGEFERHPYLPVGRSINILAALRQAEADKTGRELVEPCKASVAARTSKGETEIASCASCSAAERQDNLAKLRQVRDHELTKCEIRGLQVRVGYEMQRRLADQDSALLQRLNKQIVDLQNEIVGR